MAEILVVDDEEQMRRYMSTVLKNGGHSVWEAPDGKIAIRVLPEAAFDLIITDVAMPEMDGLELISEVRRRRPAIRVLAISGAGCDGPDHYLKLARHFGAHSVLLKPFGPSRFIDNVIAVLGIENRAPAGGLRQPAALHA